jgi:hypothetical protein
MISQGNSGMVDKKKVLTRGVISYKELSNLPGWRGNCKVLFQGNNFFRNSGARSLMARAVQSCPQTLFKIRI